MLQVRVNQLFQGFFIAPILGIHCNGKTLVQIGPGVDQTGIMQCANAFILLCFRCQIIQSAVQQLLRLALNLVMHHIRTGIIPFQGSLGAHNTDMLGGHVTGIDTGAPHASHCTIFIAHQYIGIVLQRITGTHKGLTVTQDLLQLLLRANQLGHIIGMGGQVTQYKGTSYLGGIDTPFLTFILDITLRVTAKAMGIPQVNHIDFAQHAGGYHGTHLLQHLKAGEAIGNTDQLALFLCQLFDFFSLLRFKEQRLFTDDMQTGFQRCLGHFIMQKIRGCHVNSFNAIGTLCFLCKHGLIIRIAALLIHAQITAKLLAAFCIHIECSSRQHKGSIVPHSAQTMLITYLGGLAASYNTPAERCSVNQFLSNIHGQSILSSYNNIFFSVFYELSILLCYNLFYLRSAAWSFFPDRIITPL